MRYFLYFFLALAGIVLMYVLISNFSPALPTPVGHPARVTSAAIQEKTDAYTIDVKYPQFGIPSIDAEIKTKVEQSIAAFKKDVRDAGASQGAPYEFGISFDTPYAGDDIVSAKLISSSYLGGAHPLAIANGLNFDRKSGRELTLDDALLMIGRSLPQVASRAKQELQRKLGSEMIAPEGADPKPDNYSTFVIDGAKVTFIFQLYQVAPYAVGFQEVSFSRKR